MEENKTLNENDLDKVAGGRKTTKYHYVRAGESLAEICMSYGVYNYGAVAAYNGLSTTDITAGMVIKIIVDED